MTLVEIWNFRSARQDCWGRECNSGNFSKTVWKFLPSFSTKKDLAQLFKMEGNLVAYSDVDGLVTALSINHSPEEWRLFLDSTTLRLTAVLLSNDDYMI